MYKIRSFASICLIFLLSTSLSFAGNEGYEIKVKINGLSDTTVFLANFFGKNQYYKDTAKTDKDGNMVFSGDQPLDEGLYTLVLDRSKIIDFLVIEQKFSIETDTNDYLGSLKIKGSEENKLFFEYVDYLSKKQNEAAKVNAAVDTSSEESKTKAQDELTVIDTDVKSYQKDFIEKNGETFAAKFIKSMMEVEIPDPPMLDNGKVDSTFGYRYYKAHFFDNIDFSDSRYLRTPVFHQKLSKYIQKLTVQYPDSLTKSIDFVIGKAKENYELFQYCVSWITNTYEKSKIMGMDAIFVHMAEKYYLTDQVGWIDSAQTEKIKERYTKMKPILIGKKAPNIILADTAQKTWYNLHQLESEYTILYIWSPTCGHCKKVTPKMHDLYLKYKDQGLKVYAVSTEYENVEWKKYIKKNKLTWINVSDSPEYPNNIQDHPNNFRTNYDVFSTPKIYLLDKDKMIIAKKLEDEQLDDLIGRLIKEKKEESNTPK